MKLVFLLLALPLIMASTTCEQFIDDLQTKVSNNDLQNLTYEEKMFLSASAPSAAPLGLGDKAMCDDATSMKYLVALRVYIKTLGFKTGVDYGVCLPLECTLPEIANDQLVLTKLFNLQKWTIPSGNTLQLYDPNSPIAEKGALFYITCLLFAYFFFMSVGSAIANYIYQKKQLHTHAHHEHYDEHDHEHEHEHEEHGHEHDHDHDNLHNSHHDLQKVVLKVPEHPNEPKTKKLHWIFQAYDIKENFLALIKTAKEAHTDENLEVLGLLKIGTVFYVVYANCFGPYLKFLVNNASYTDFFKTTISNLNLSADFTSEYFFVMGGFLCASKMIPHLSKVKFGLGVYLAHLRQKLFQVWPLFIMSYLFFWQITPQLYKGPLGFVMQWEAKSCEYVWWTKLLYIENLTNGKTVRGAGGYCVPTVWYMDAEFQVLAIGILVFALFLKNRRLGYIVCALLYIQAFGLAVAAFYKYDLYFDITAPTLYETKFKWIPCKRWSNFFLGSIFGMQYYEYNTLNRKTIFNIFEKSKLISYGVMIVGACLNLWLVFFVYTRENASSIWTPDLERMWYGIRIILTGGSMLCIFMPMAAHRDCLIKRFLLLRPFQVFSKYTASLYIYHQGINYAIMYSRTTDVETFSHGAVCIQTILVIIIGEVVATIVHLTIEKPFVKIEAKIAEYHIEYHPINHLKSPTGIMAKWKAKKQVELDPIVTSGLTLKSMKCDQTETTSPGSVMK